MQFHEPPSGWHAAIDSRPAGRTTIHIDTLRREDDPAWAGGSSPAPDADPWSVWTSTARARQPRVCPGPRCCTRCRSGQPSGPPLALLVSCGGRRLPMGQRTADEAEAVGEALDAGTVRIGF